MSTLADSIGLVLDIAGALLLLKFGLAPRLDPKGHVHLIAE